MYTYTQVKIHRCLTLHEAKLDPNTHLSPFCSLSFSVYLNDECPLYVKEAPSKNLLY